MANATLAAVAVRFISSTRAVAAGLCAGSSASGCNPASCLSSCSLAATRSLTRSRGSAGGASLVGKGALGGGQLAQSLDRNRFRSSFRSGISSGAASFEPPPEHEGSAGDRGQQRHRAAAGEHRLALVLVPGLRWRLGRILRDRRRLFLRWRRCLHLGKRCRLLLRLCFDRRPARTAPLRRSPFFFFFEAPVSSPARLNCTSLGSVGTWVSSPSGSIARRRRRNRRDRVGRHLVGEEAGRYIVFAVRLRRRPSCRTCRAIRWIDCGRSDGLIVMPGRWPAGISC